MNKLVFMFVFPMLFFCSCSLFIAVSDSLSESILIKVENRTFENIKVDTGYRLYKDGKYQNRSVRVLARSIKAVTVKKGAYLSAEGERSGFLYPSKNFNKEGEVWVVDY